MGYVFNFQDTLAYERWYDKETNRFMSDLEIALMLHMLKPFKGETLIDIGCGTGRAFPSLLDKGVQITGVDPSPYMIDRAKEKGGIRVELRQGYAEDLPFEDNAFNHAIMLTTLEYVSDFSKALEEAFRVAKDRVFIGVLNRYAFINLQRRIKGIFSATIYNRARFFSVWELKQLIWEKLGDVPVSWKSVNQLPVSLGKIAAEFEKSVIVQRSPLGAFLGIVVSLVPRYQARPLSLKYSEHEPKGANKGYAGNINEEKNIKRGVH